MSGLCCAKIHEGPGQGLAFSPRRPQFLTRLHIMRSGSAHGRLQKNRTFTAKNTTEQQSLISEEAANGGLNLAFKRPMEMSIATHSNVPETESQPLQLLLLNACARAHCCLLIHHRHKPQ